MKKVLVTGADGMLGEAIASVFNKYDLILTDTEELDVRYHTEFNKYARHKYKYIIHLAAITDLEYCEKNPADAYIVNTIGTYNAMQFSRKIGCPLIHISTAGVFDGSKEFYTEEDIPNPMNVYGRSKHISEVMALLGEQTYIFRAGWMMGGGRVRDKKFVRYIIDQIDRGTTFIKGVDDMWGSPTYTWDLATQIYHVVEAKSDFGIYHSAGKGRCTRYDVAKKIVEYMGMADIIHVDRVESKAFKESFPCKRSVNEAMLNSRLDGMGMNVMGGWEYSLKSYIEKDYANV